jgi:ribosomal protein S20
LDISIVALIVGIVSICLAFFAIWQANHHRDQSDKLNRDTTEKLARIEAFATSTKEDAFAEVRRWGEFARAGGKGFEEAEKAKEEEIKKLKEEIQTTTSAEINKVLQTVESKLNSSTQASTISEIKQEFEELKKEIGKIQDKAVVNTNKADKRSRIRTILANVSPSAKAMLRAIAQNPGWTKIEDLQQLGYGYDEIRTVLTLVNVQGLLTTGRWKFADGRELMDVKLDQDLKEVLLR